MDQHKNTLSIPKEAVLYRDGQAVVFTYEEFIPEPEEKQDDADRDQEEDSKQKDTAPEDTGPKWKAKSVDITVGYSDEKVVEVLSGLQEGDPIITTGNTALKEESLILIEAPTTKVEE